MFHSGQTDDACAFPAIILQRKKGTNVESFTLTAKLNTVSENLSFSLRVYVQNEVIVMHRFPGVKFCSPGHVIHRFHTNFALVNVLK